jgi:hypothetical protein
MNREELDAAWERFSLRNEWDSERLKVLLSQERAFVDRAAQAKAIRWAASYAAPEGHRMPIYDLADRVERGEVEIPE